jgi:hypothetical protein
VEEEFVPKWGEANDLAARLILSHTFDRQTTGD